MTRTLRMHAEHDRQQRLEYVFLFIYIINNNHMTMFTYIYIYLQQSSCLTQHRDRLLRELFILSNQHTNDDQFLAFMENGEKLDNEKLNLFLEQHKL